MGLPKATLPFGNEIMLTRVIRLLNQVVDPIVVVAARNQELPDLPDQIIVSRDRRENQGPLEGLAAGLATIRGQADLAYCTSCDVPLLQPKFVQRLVELLGDYEVIVTKEDRFYHPLAALYRTSVLSEIEELLQRDQKRPMFLFDKVKTRHIDVEQMRSVDPDLQTLDNLNCPDDYFVALTKAGFDVPIEVKHALSRGSEK